MNRSYRKDEVLRIWKNVGAALTVVLLLSLSACSFRQPGGKGEAQAGGPAENTGRANTGFVLTGPDSYDSADTAILVGRNKEDSTVTFLNLDLGRRYTLSVDGTTRFYDKYGGSISLEQLSYGDIVDVTFLKAEKHLTTLTLSPQAWRQDDVENYELNMTKGEVSIGLDVYGLTKNTQYLSGGRYIEQMDLNAADVLSFQGIENTVLSVSVEKGHGYLRLANDENFVGGWIEVGQSLIHRINEDMLLTVPEGSYQVKISHNGSGGTKDVVVNRNQEVTLDIGDLEVAEPQKGIVLFSLTPANLELYIDGTLADASRPVEMEYGIHQIIAKAEGYKSVTRYLSVGQASASYDIVLEPVDSGDKTVSGGNLPSSSQTGTGSPSVDKVTSYYKVYVDAPKGAEVYLDGSYVGIAPCSFRKTEGSHVITLRKSGYVTRSYTVSVDGEDKDVTFSFADLEVNSTGSTNYLDSLVSDALGALTGIGKK